MYLLVDNTAQSARLELVTNKKSVHWLAKDNEQLTALLERVLKKAKCQLTDLQGVAVLLGKGRFTATRLAVTFANTLGYALKIPVVGILENENWQEKIATQPVGVYVSAAYSGPAHISGQPTKL